MSWPAVRAARGSAVALLLAAAPPSGALAQTLGQAPAAPFPWLRWLLALAFCLLLAVAGGLALRARAAPGRGLEGLRRWRSFVAPGSRGERRLAVVESVRVSATLEVCLLQCDSQQYLVAATPQAATQLASFPATGAEHR